MLEPGSGWVAVDGKPGIFTHVDRPACEVEINFYACTNADCANRKVVYHAVCDCDDHRSDLSIEQRRAMHGLEVCCGQQMARVG